MTQWTLAAATAIGHPRNYKSWPRALLPITGSRRLSASWAFCCLFGFQVKPSRRQGLHCPGQEIRIRIISAIKKQILCLYHTNSKIYQSAVIVTSLLPPILLTEGPV
ncbi:hypothetical protein BJX63DRAFT_169355 [Aspergillus granulosus]|uniref:Uncharacterized protein n=1 Tax=Aspergillus granulosus TaxID=176169 RepID=A0ABR4HHW9_9EURO